MIGVGMAVLIFGVWLFLAGGFRGPPESLKKLPSNTLILQCRHLDPVGILQCFGVSSTSRRRLPRRVRCVDGIVGAELSLARRAAWAVCG